MLSLIVIIALSYLVGSLPASVWIGKQYGIDIRHHGSGNAGATNVFRTLGWRAGVLATFADSGKGFIAALLVASIRLDSLPSGIAAWEIETVVRLIAGVAAVVGHMFPIWAGFRGGKGVNTSMGALLAITPITMAITLAVFIIVLMASRYVSLASIIAALAFPAAAAVRRYIFGVEGLDPSLLFIGGMLALAVILAHRSNIKRLLSGTENRIRTFRPGGRRLKATLPGEA